MSLLAWQDGVQTSLHSTLERAGAVAAPSSGRSQPAHFGSPAGELAACCHAVGLLVTGASDTGPGTAGEPGADHRPAGTVGFELFGRRVDKVIRDLGELRPETRWSRCSDRTAITTVPVEDALALWWALAEAGRCHGLANVGHEAATRFRLLESQRA